MQTIRQRHQDPSTCLSLLCVLCASAVKVVPVFAGDLNPPPGPIAPTHKTLTQVEPRIPINATNTPGDANSLFRITQPGSYYLAGNITGVSGKHGIEIAASNVSIDLMGFSLLGVAGSIDGITTDTSRDHLMFRNGTISSWGSSGINLSNAGAGFNSIIEGVIAANNGDFGIVSNQNSVVRGCAAQGNGSHGIFGITNATIIGCAARENAGHGITTGNGAAITDCSARDNSGDGFTTGVGSTITNCSAINNTGHGIVVSSGCAVRGNTCSGSGFGAGDGAGIRVAGSDNRIEGNNCTVGDRGIDVDAGGNLIIRNSCSGNTINYALIVNNRYGVILDISALGGAAVNGSAAASTLTSSDSTANYSY